MCWPRYLVWDRRQIELLINATDTASVAEVVGPIWFSDAPVKRPMLKPNTFAVFDVQPKRYSLYAERAFDFDYYIPEVAEKFLFDIAKACMELKCQMAFKQKRSLGKDVHPYYRRHTLKEIETSERFTEVDSELSADFLIEHCDASISIPFTSTALIGVHFDKPSIYYDPTCELQADDPAAHGVRIIQGYSDLIVWMRDQITAGLK